MKCALSPPALVDELHVDLNTLVTGEAKYLHYGPLLKYAAREPNGAAIMRYLLEQGADQTIAAADSTTRTKGCARNIGAAEVIEVPKLWSKAKDKLARLLACVPGVALAQQIKPVTVVTSLM